MGGEGGDTPNAYSFMFTLVKRNKVHSIQYGNTLFIPQGAVPSDRLTKTTQMKAAIIQAARPGDTGEQFKALFIVIQL